MVSDVLLRLGVSRDLKVFSYCQHITKISNCDKTIAGVSVLTC